MSLGLAFAAFSSKDSQYSDNYATGNRNFVSMAEQCGFENIQSNKWMFQPAETDSIGINCASKTIRDNGGSYTLIAVGVRGNNYHAEWGGNARLDATGEHKGFALGRDQALDYLRSYIADTGISGRVKIWIAGYSRGAAVSNMVGGALDNGYSLGEGVSLSPHDLYCYCYETPMGTTKNQVQGRLYDNIQNLVNANDLVTYVAFDNWTSPATVSTTSCRPRATTTTSTTRPKCCASSTRSRTTAATSTGPTTSRPGASTRRTSRAAIWARSSRST